MASQPNYTPRIYCDRSNVFIGFERAGVQGRTGTFQDKDCRARTWEAQHMIETIIRPLLQRRGMEALQIILNETEFLIYRGLLQNIREVEVTLLTSGRVSSKCSPSLHFLWLTTPQWNAESREVFERFYDLVTSQCDEAMRSSGFNWSPSWRDDYYVDSCDKVLEISKGSDNPQLDESTVNLCQNSSVLARVPREHPILDLPTSPSSTGNGGSALESSPDSVMSFTFTGSPQTSEFDSYTTSPTTISQASISPTSPDSSTQTTSGVSCKFCSRVFKGNPQDAASNLRRHLMQRKLKCPMPECETKDPMRSDNLGPHLQNFHKMSSKSERQDIIRERKVAARRVDSKGNPRRRCHRE